MTSRGSAKLNLLSADRRVSDLRRRQGMDIRYNKAVEKRTCWSCSTWTNRHWSLYNPIFTPRFLDREAVFPTCRCQAWIVNQISRSTAVSVFSRS